MKNLSIRLSIVFAAAGSLLAGVTDGTVSPTPEPGTIALLAAGLGGLGYVAWRRKRK